MRKNASFHIERANDGGMTFTTLHKRYGIFPLLLLFFSIGIACTILVGRLFQLTIVKGSYYRQLAEQNRLREITIESQRGSIFDRNGIMIAENTSPNIDFSDTYIPSHRTYAGTPEAYAHVMGYRQTADEKDIVNDECVYKIQPKDKVGKKGIEKAFECVLRGKHGKKMIEVDAHGSLLRTISAVSPVAGESVHLSLDARLQNIAYAHISSFTGAVVALKPGTGEVLALTSSPSFNPQVFEDADSSRSAWYLSDTNKPLFNRATEGTYPPGSVFKLNVATAGLEEHVIDTSFTVEDNGFITLGERRFGNWYFIEQGKTEGIVDIVKSIQRSNDIFYYELGAKLGPEKMKQWAERFGYGSKTGIGIEEKAGTIPSPFWKEDVLDERWFTGDSYNYAIGQGYVLTTPLQVSLATSVIASDGYRCKPLLKKVDENNQPQCIKLSIQGETIQLVQKGMKQACSVGGTGWPFFSFPMHVACKTGTAESHGKNTNPHAWFTVYTPADNPKIVLTVLIEHGGQGSSIAGSIAKEILAEYFQ